MLVNIFDHSFPKDMNADVCGNNNVTTIVNRKSIKGDAAMVDANTEAYPLAFFGKEVFIIVLRRYILCTIAS